MNRFVMPSTSLNAMEQSRPPAFVQPAALRNCAYYEQRFEELEKLTTRQKGELLAEWKASETWKEKFKSWGDACEHAAGVSKRWANKLIEDVVGSKIPPPSISSPQAVAKPNTCENRSSVEDPPKAKENRPESTPEDNHKPEPKPQPPTDLSGAVIPQDLLSLVERKAEVTQMEFYASKLHAFFQSVQKDSDPLWRKLRMMATIQTFTSSAQTMQWSIRECSPEVVCPGCGAGSKQSGCSTCDGTGMISEVRWNRDWVKSTDKAKQAIVHGRNHA